MSRLQHQDFVVTKINVDKLSSTKNLKVKDNQMDHISKDQMQQQLVKNIQKNTELHYDNPNFRRINPINYTNQPEQKQPKPHMKLLEASHIDHISGNYAEAPKRKELNQGTFSHLQNTSSNQPWKSSSKRIDFKPTEPKPEQNAKKMTNYYDKYARNPIFEGELVKSCTNFRQSAGDQRISDNTLNLNSKKHGFDGERKKKQFGGTLQSFNRVLNEHQGTKTPQNNNKSQQQYQSQTPQNPHKQQQSEQWPLRSDIPKKKEVGNVHLAQNRQQKQDVYSVLHCDYGQPHKNYTGKITEQRSGGVGFGQVNQGDYRRKYNVLQKEELSATAQARNYKDSLKFY